MIVDQSPALELLLSEGVVAGAAGIDRLVQKPWTVRAGAVVVATGGCGFMSNALGTNGLTGDGLLLAAEAGAIFSGMERTGRFGVAPAFSSVTKGLLYFWATFSDRDGNELRREGDRYAFVARHPLNGPVYAVIDKASPRMQEGMRKGQPNMFLPFDRQGIDPFKQRFELTLRHEGTVRGHHGAGSLCRRRRRVARRSGRRRDRRRRPEFDLGDRERRVVGAERRGVRAPNRAFAVPAAHDGVGRRGAPAKREGRCGHLGRRPYCCSPARNPSARQDILPHRVKACRGADAS